eukprot:2372048-Alexandrium_andersonii.AAC.1
MSSVRQCLQHFSARTSSFICAPMCCRTSALERAAGSASAALRLQLHCHRLRYGTRCVPHSRTQRTSCHSRVSVHSTSALERAASSVHQRIARARAGFQGPLGNVGSIRAP